MDSKLQTIKVLRQQLHACPEVSCQEFQTKKILMDFIQENTSLEMQACGDGFCAIHREENPTQPAIAIRADYDAVATADGVARHLCGHDGHAAALCGAALEIDGQNFGRNIILLFQPAEEIGEGAKSCVEIFDKEEISEIYGIHNLPGFPFGQVVTKEGTFACASHGLSLKLKGAPTHAAYPENGISPAPAVGTLLCCLPQLADPARYTGMTLCTVIGTAMGEKAFGAAAEAAEVWLTLRAEHDRDLTALHDAILTLAKTLAAEYGLGFSWEVQDVFPATENDPVCTQKVLDLCGGDILEAPMRWSEDFGHYLNHVPGAFFGIGAGTDHPPLHTAQYEYPDALLEPTVQAFLNLLEG